MMTDKNITPAVEGSALYTHNPSQNNKAGKGRPRCNHCKKLGHVKATCLKLHDKPADWKPSNGRYENCANAAVTTKNGVEGSPFTKEQIEALHYCNKCLTKSPIQDQHQTPLQSNTPASLPIKVSNPMLFLSKIIIQNRG